MNSENDIREELRNMGSMLADMPRTMPYVVPMGYFEDIAGSVTNTVMEINAAETMPGWGKTLPYTIPAGYFEALPSILATKVTTEHPLSKDLPYHAPDGYFEMFPAQVLQAAKVADTPKRRILSGPVKWLAAAMLVLGIGMGSYRVYTGTRTEGTDTILASVPNNDIQDYLQPILRVDINRIVRASSENNMNVADKDIVEYLNETGWD